MKHFLASCVAFSVAAQPLGGAIAQSQSLDQDWLDRAIARPRPTPPNQTLDQDWLDRAINARNPPKQSERLTTEDLDRMLDRTAPPQPARQVEVQATLTQSLDAIVRSDARGWAAHIYDVGSMRGANVRSSSADGTTYIARGYYTYNAGRPGWVDARVSNGRLVCIEYWNTWFGCRQPNQPGTNSYTPAIVAAVVVAVVAAVASGSGNSDYSTGAGFGSGDDPEGSSGRRAATTERERRGTTERIGGESGLYGCASPPCWDRPEPD
jgi:hypothetical protein